MVKEKERHGSHTIVVVDGSEFFRSELVDFLKGQPRWKVVGEASDGAGAIGIVRALDPELVLMDIHLPNMDGVEASYHIRNDNRKTRIVFLSVHDEEIYQSLAEYCHVDGFVSKASVKQDLPKVLSRIEDELHHARMPAEGTGK